MFDAGVNLLSERFETESVLKDAISAGITGILVIASSLEESYAARALCEKHDSEALTLRFTAGVHPHHASTWATDHAAHLTEIALDRRCSAIGECGLDFNRNFSSPESQVHAFSEQLKIAAGLNKGVYLHERDAFDSQVSMLQGIKDSVPFMIAHCFTGNQEQLKQYLALGCYIGITGWICDPKRGQILRDAIGKLPLSKLLVETDSPFLFPKTARPRRSNNEPKYLIHVINEIAELKQTPADKIKEITLSNAKRLFRS